MQKHIYTQLGKRLSGGVRNELGIVKVVSRAYFIIKFGESIFKSLNKICERILPCESPNLTGIVSLLILLSMTNCGRSLRKFAIHLTVDVVLQFIQKVLIVNCIKSFWQDLGYSCYWFSVSVLQMSWLIMLLFN